MAKVQVWVAGALALVVAIVAAGWFAFISPQRAHAAKYKSEAATQDLSNDSLQSRVNMLTAQQTAVPGEQARVAAILQEVPTTPALPNYVRSLVSAAGTAGVDLESIAPSAPQAVTAAAAAGAAAGSTTTTGAAGSAGAAGAVPSLQALTIAVKVNGGYFQIQQFIAGLEKMSRATVVTGVSLAPGAPLAASGAGGSGSAPSSAAPSPTPPAWTKLDASITLSVFMTPLANSAPAVAPAAAATPSASASASPAPASATPSPSK